MRGASARECCEGRQRGETEQERMLQFARTKSESLLLSSSGSKSRSPGLYFHGLPVEVQPSNW
eukprot:6194483-Pleurochrysis_carterae.AAC.2